MRVSIRKNDSGYDNFLNNGYHKCRVYLNGVEVHEVITADEEEGMLIKMMRGPDGLYIKDGCCDVMTEELKGEVQIKREIRGMV